MSEECTHDCSTCSANCSSKEKAQDLRAKLNDLSSIKKVYAVVSGKGGVGKSTVTSLLALNSQKKGLKTAILDADITGPSIPKMFGINGKATGDGDHIFPATSRNGTDLISINMMLENETDPVVWRGPVIAGAVKQFWTDVIWDNIDVMYIDMPPGTGDVPLTVFQSIPVDGIIVVTSPQELVSMIVEKAVKMAAMMKIPIVGIVENMSGFKCPECGHVHNIFGKSKIDETAKTLGIKKVSKLPIDPKLAELADDGRIEDYAALCLSELDF